MGNNPEVASWFIGGHSKGAALAAKYAGKNSEKLKGLLLLGTTHPKSVEYDLSKLPLPVLKIFASRDGLATPEKVLENRRLLPPQTVFHEIKGGNHSQFGYYGFQLGDYSATISREAQQEETLSLILSFLDKNQLGDVQNH